jgi:hypothetical protein
VADKLAGPQTDARNLRRIRLYSTRNERAEIRKRKVENESVKIVVEVVEEERRAWGDRREEGGKAFYMCVGIGMAQSAIARRSSGLRRKSRNPVLWMPTYEPFLVSSPFWAPLAAVVDGAAAFVVGSGWRVSSSSS